MVKYYSGTFLIDCFMHFFGYFGYAFCFYFVLFCLLFCLDLFLPESLITGYCILNTPYIPRHLHLSTNVCFVYSFIVYSLKN